jgi:UDP-N-acetylmuramate--alanine ligase
MTSSSSARGSAAPALDAATAATPIPPCKDGRPSATAVAGRQVRLSIERAHLIGIGGAGLSGLARLLQASGVRVSGSDERMSEVTQELVALGVNVRIGHAADNVAPGGGWCVRSAAITDDNPELRNAARMRMRCLLYAEAVGLLSEELRTLAVAGTHGKTTTTAMTVAGLRAAGVVPFHLIGGQVPELGGNGWAGQSDVLVVEACEFNRSFHQVRPQVAAILNVDADHFDCYPDLSSLEQAFAEFAARTRRSGAVVVHESVPGQVLDLLGPGVRTIRFGVSPLSAVRAEDLCQLPDGRFRFTPVLDRRRLPAASLSVHGSHNVHNALAALALAHGAGADAEAAMAGIAAFPGVRRRFERHRGPRGGILVNDYAHHPVEIRAVIETARRAFPGRRLLVAFQPHQHLRTQRLLPEFAAVLALADHCLVAPIYGAREPEEIKALVSAADLAREVSARNATAEATATLAELPEHVARVRKPGDVVLLLGAGDIDTVLGDLVRRL